MPFATYVECHKMTYQSMLAPAKKTNYVAYNPSTPLYHFSNEITDFSLAQAKLSLNSNHNYYSGNFNANIEYLMNQVSHQQVNQQLNFTAVGSGAPRIFKIPDDKGHNLELPLDCYTPKEWAQLFHPQEQYQEAAGTDWWWQMWLWW